MTTGATQTEPQIEKPSLEALGLAGWRSNSDLPRGLTAERVKTELDKAHRYATPACLTDLANAIDELVAFGRVFDLLARGNPEDIETITSIYGKGLSDMPVDVLWDAIDAVKLNWKWPRMPLPADIRIHVIEEITRRRSIINILERVLVRIKSVKAREPVPTMRALPQVPIRRMPIMRDPTPAELEQTRREWEAVAAEKAS